jgi:hypothetical protein
MVSVPFVVIPAKAGIQMFQRFQDLGSSFRFGRDDVFYFQGHFPAAC